MPQRRTVSLLALLILAVVAVAPLASATDSPWADERAPSFRLDPIGFLGTWLGHLLGFETAATGTSAPACGEAGPQIDPDGRCASSTDAGPQIDPDGR